MIYRKKYIDLFHEIIVDKKNTLIALTGTEGVGKSTFIKECITYDIFGKPGTFQYIQGGDEEELPLQIAIDSGVLILVIDGFKNGNIDTIRSIIERQNSKLRVVFTSEEELLDEDVKNFTLPGLSLREYLEHEFGEIKIGAVLGGEVDIAELNSHRDTYIQEGSSPYCLLAGGSVMEGFLKKRAFIYQELFEKEHEQFDTFLRTLTMNVGIPFKADQIAKLLGISRRKVNKYTEILLSHNVIVALGPWVKNQTTETSRHVKLYFKELGFMKAILGEIHAEGTLKQGVMENLIYLELERKLSDTHTLSFYRKKSGAEISFIAENSETEMITPIQVNVRSTDAIPQVFRVFDEDYGESVERYMIFNDTKALKSTVGERQLLILPHVAV